MKASVAIVVSLILFFFVGGRVADSHTGALETQQQQILSATVMITFTTPNWQEKTKPTVEALPIPNDEYRTIARAEGDVAADGLGTLVANGDALLLVTHDHWSHFDDALGTVTFQAADGAWLADIDLRTFREHVQYHDGSIMILAAPDVLTMAVPVTSASLSTGKATALQANTARLSSPKTLQTGDRGFVAQRAGGRIAVSEVSVIAQAEKQGRPIVRLQSVDGQVVAGGDSGGGVWVNGRIAAVMWATVMMENRATSVQRTTDVSIAAVYQGIPE